jgi:hypothetical protein
MASDTPLVQLVSSQNPRQILFHMYNLLKLITCIKKYFHAFTFIWKGYIHFLKKGHHSHFKFSFQFFIFFKEKKRLVTWSYSNDGSLQIIEPLVQIA